jgi:flagellar M-ring protein FliF
MAVLQSLSLRGRITLGAVALGTLVVLVLLFKVASAPQMQTVQAGLDPAQAAKVTGALDERGIAYELTNGGTAVAVEAGKAPQARMALATAGVGGGAGADQPGFELLDQQKLGTSSFQQQVAYQRALEGQIAQTIGQIAGVSSAQVRLSMPKDELFTDEQKPATAAVLLGGSGLDPGAVKGIASLVAGSVPDLQAKDVTITDGAGNLLWPAGDGAGGTSKAAAETRKAAAVSASIDALLARTLGPDRAQVRVSADVDVDQTTEEKLTYARRGTPLTSVDERETLQGGAGAGAAAGTTPNLGVAQQAAGAGGRSNYRKTSRKTDWGVDKTVTRTRKAPGTVQRMSVAVLVDANLNPPPDVAALRTAVATAAGVVPGRDTVSVQAVPFAKAPAAAAKPGGPLAGLPTGATSLAKWAALGVGALLFGFFVTRHLRRREADALADEPSWLRELRGPAVTPELPAPAPAPAAHEPLDMPTLEAFHDPRKVAIEELVEREPERVAAQLRSWITEDGR